MNKKLNVQHWIQIEKILENGIIKVQKNKYIKIIKVLPINFNLKSNFEKESILNSYKIFLKTCNFNIQILILSNKKNLEKNISNVEKNLKKENKEFLKNIGKDYIEFIDEKNKEKTSASKDFYIIISNSEYSEKNIEELIIEGLNDKYFKIKECLQRCGNETKDINTKREVEKILYEFYNKKL